jgi:hypothetical protein
MVPYWNIPPMALAAGVSIGVTIGIIGDLRRIIIDEKTCNSDVKKGLVQRVNIVFATWCTTPVLAFAGLAFRQPVFGILAFASSGVSFAVMLSLKGEVQKNSKSFHVDTQTKLAKAVEYVFLTAIPAIGALAYTLVVATLEHLRRRN